MRYIYTKKISSRIKIGSLAALFAGALMALITSLGALAPASVSAKGGTPPGDTWTVYQTYDAASCPMPDVIKADYVNLSSCTLAKRTGKPREFYILSDGYTDLTPVLRDVVAPTTVTLPCGNVVSVSKFTENAFAQTLPVPPPYRLSVVSDKIVDTCL